LKSVETPAGFAFGGRGVKILRQAASEPEIRMKLLLIQSGGTSHRFLVDDGRPEADAKFGLPLARMAEGGRW